MSPAQPTRAYDSTGRQARAAENRARVIRAALELFVANGFAATTIADVAARAGVSAPTVYAGFESKAALLKRCIDVALAGDDDDVPVADRPMLRWVYETPDPAELLSRYAAAMGQVAPAAGPIHDVLVRAADSEPELTALLADLERQRLKAASTVAEAVRARGGLPPGRSVEEARDTIWICNAPELYVTLTRKRRWSTKRYVAWARNSLIKLVLEPPAEAPASAPAPEPPGH